MNLRDKGFLIPVDNHRWSSGERKHRNMSAALKQNGNRPSEELAPQLGRRLESPKLNPDTPQFLELGSSNPIFINTLSVYSV